MSEDSMEPRSGRARTDTSSNGRGKLGSPSGRTRKTRVQAAPLPESRTDAQEEETNPPHHAVLLEPAEPIASTSIVEQDIEPVTTRTVSDQPVRTESEPEDRDPIESPTVLRPMREQYTPLSMSHQLNLPAIELIASPFHSFREIGRFQQTLSTLPGVQSVQPRQLQRGILQLRVECRNAREMLRALSTDYPTSFSLVSHEMHQVEIVFDESAYPQLVAAGPSRDERGA